MTPQKEFKSEEITLEDLVKEMLEIPDGFHEEVFIENGKVVFSAPLTQNTWIGKDDCPSEHLDSYIGSIESISVGDIEGLYQRKDGKYERKAEDETDTYNFDGKVVSGEFYEQAEIISIDDVISIIAKELDYPASQTIELIKKIQEA